jgi:hypothetical protein
MAAIPAITRIAAMIQRIVAMVRPPRRLKWRTCTQEEGPTNNLTGATNARIERLPTMKTRQIFVNEDFQ